MTRALLAAPLALLVNAADPISPGDAVGEPSPALADVAIERETLRLDLRPLASLEPAIVEARYALRNDGRRRRLELVFVATALDDDGAVWLDGQPVDAEPAAAGELPMAWRAPSATPSLDAGAPLLYRVESAGEEADGLRFRIDLPPGRHEMRVVYRARATAHSGGEPTQLWQLGYVLAPARRWAAFGGLDVEVRLPAGWRAASDPALARSGDRLSGSWDELPADALALTLQAPPPAAWPYWLLFAGALAAGLALCAGAGALVGRRLGSRGRTSAWALPLALTLPWIWLFAAVPAFLYIPRAARERAGSQAAWTYGSGYPYALLALVPALLVIGFAATQLAAWIARRRAARAAPNDRAMGGRG